MLQPHITFKDWLNENYLTDYQQEQEILNIIYEDKKIRNDIRKTITYLNNSDTQCKATLKPDINKAGDITLTVTIYITSWDNWHIIKDYTEKTIMDHLTSTKINYWWKCIDPEQYTRMRTKQHGKHEAKQNN